MWIGSNRAEILRSKWLMGERDDIPFEFETVMKGKIKKISKAGRVTYKANGCLPVSENYYGTGKKAYQLEAPKLDTILSSLKTFYPPTGSLKPHSISSPVTGYHKPYEQRPPCDGHFQSITQCDNRWVDKGTVITQSPSFIFQREYVSVSVVSDKTVKAEVSQHILSLSLVPFF
ncbi:hypothetical protein AVEN_77488-1 [Araneus ventricosus]|uniref:Uncharacterized protein n=1 Tax=Araneus ventricosus TaxID=182803 RepID=A0A4Y2NE01_ARAVE|nr:hypothetical protein AVEN_77488-1 [Araneus ventricosus]